MMVTIVTRRISTSESSQGVRASGSSYKDGEDFISDFLTGAGTEAARKRRINPGTVGTHFLLTRESIPPELVG